MAPQKTSYPKQDIKILLLEGISPNAVETFRAAGYGNIVTHAKALPEDELRKAIADAHFIGIRSRTQLTAEVLAEAKRLLAIGCFCIGTNQVDLEAAELAGIPVFNAPYSNTRSVAELVLAEAIMLLRGIPQKSAQCHRGGWSKSAAGSHEARGKTLGIVGYGHIGTQVGVLAEALGMQVLFHDIETKLSLGNARASVDLDELLAKSDVVTLHVPDTAATRWMIGAAQIARMKPGAHLINAARGSVVDIDALAAALRGGHLGGAAVDVFPEEPKGNDDPLQSPLCGIDNVILTPHVGGSTLEAQDNIGIEVAAKLVRYSDNGSTLSAVNFPEVTLPEHVGSHRILHIHRNVPGVLSKINEIFGERGINIDGQFLRTDANVGYVVIDVSADDAQATELRAALAAIPGTLRTRVLYRGGGGSAPARQPLAGHAPHRGIGAGVVGERVDRAPGQVVRFLADHVGFVAAGADHVAHVVMPVRGHALVLGDPVAVEVEDPGLQAQPGQAGFLRRLLHRGDREVAFAIGMPAQLQPQAQLAMVGQQHALAGRVHQPARGGEMAGEALAPERVVRIAQQVDEQRRGGGLVGMPCRIAGEGRRKVLVEPVHVASPHARGHGLSPAAWRLALVRAGPGV